MDDLIADFIAETNESLEELDLDLVALEQNPNDKDLLSKIFRLMHTIKGTCGFLGLPRLEKVAHHAENVLGRFRDGDLEVTPEYVTLIFESIDQIKFIVGNIASTGSEPDGDDADLIQRLDAVYEGKGANDPSSSQDQKLPATEEEIDFEPVPAPSLQKAIQDATPNEETNEEQEQDATAPEAPSPDTTSPETTPPETPAVTAGPVATTQTLRVNVDVLENLMTMVSEMVLTRNQLLQILRKQTESEFSVPLQRLNIVVSELQEGVMKTRMQPIGNAWSKLPRIIRDLSMELGKKINLEMRGQDTELDRQVLDLIKDPLTHMVRNSGDHGIETPDIRKAAGKPETGTILLNAYHEGGHIIIEITDDGKGLSSDKIKQKILEKGLATEDDLADMNTQQINQFIFKAGFSTAEQVTSVSGRGVGMDVVRTNIEKIGGSIELKSVEGKGSTFLIKIPLTLAIVSALIVESAGEKFAIPQISVRELVMASEKGENRIETIKGVPVFRLRNKLLPLVSLSEILDLSPPPPVHENDTAEQEKTDGDNTPAPDTADTETGTETALPPPAPKGNNYIIVSQVGPYSFGIIVDKVYDTEEIVVKPVASILRDIDLFSGNTILGDGSVIMILDPNGIAKRAGDMELSDQTEGLDETNFHAEISGEKTSLLLFSAGDETPKAVPLSLVSRLENIKLDTIEQSGGKMMWQYRDHLMPLVPFSSSMALGTEGEKPVLVFSDKGRTMGLIVDQIIDIIEEHVDIQLEANTPGTMGSAIISGRATDVIDVMHFLSMAHSDWFKDHGDTPFETNGSADTPAQKSGNGRARNKVLLVDDSSFFRNMLKPILNVAGYDVTALESPADALKMCEHGHSFDVIISDIEMPGMDGFEFAKQVKSDDGNWKDTPMVALSSHATPQDIEHGRSVGFSDYVAKFDKDSLLNTLSQTLSGHGGRAA